MMRPAKDLVVELRKRLGFTQKQLALRAQLPDDSYVARVETGANKLTSHNMRIAFARGFDLTVQQFDDFLTGAISVDEAEMLARDNYSFEAGAPASGDAA
jgi:transcriptional regulator with XRE-family HTH domain